MFKMKIVRKSILFLNICEKYFENVQKYLIIHTLQYHKQKRKRIMKFLRILNRKIEANYMMYFIRTGTIYKEFLINIPEIPKRRLWMKRRSKDWWYKIVKNQEFDEQMVDNFRMDRKSFEYICERLHSKLAHKSHTVREALPVDMIVAIGIYKLASCAEYRVIGNQFGVHKSTVQKCFYNFCDAMIQCFLKEEIQIPSGDYAKEVIRRFRNKSGIPQILGAIDGTHIPVTAPSDGHADYINRKGWTSVVLQAVVDCNYKYVSNLEIF